MLDTSGGSVERGRMADKQAPGEVTRDMPPLEMRGAVAPGTVNDDSRTVDVVWTTGARVLRGMFEPYWEELSLDPKHVRMSRLNNGAPLLDTHKGMTGAGVASVLGVVVSARLEGSRGIATVRFAKAEDDPEADKVYRKVKDGILQNVSVGYRVHKLEQLDKMVGKTPVLRAIDWEPYEISVVPAGEDDGAGFRSAEARESNPCTIITSHKESNMDPKAETTQKPADAVVEATRAAAERRDRERELDAEALNNATQRALAEERAREVEIRSLCRDHKLGDTLADKLIKDGASITDVRAAVLSHLSSRGADGPNGLHRFEAGEDARDKFVRGACASIFQRAGISDTITAAKKNERLTEQFRDVATDPGEFRGMRLIDLARHALEMRGVSVRGLHGEALVKRALEYRDAGMNTTSDFAILLETAVNKTFLGQYAITPTTWQRWAGKKSVQDFRTATFYRPGSFGVLDSVTEAGEIKHKNIPDGAKATLTPSTKGNIIGITRRAIVNDDLGAFQNLAAGLGQAAAFSVETDAFAMITANAGLGATQADGQPLFHTNRSNIGTTGAMSVTTWDGAAAVMAVQKDVSAQMILDLKPAVWLGPKGLEMAAKVLNTSSIDPTASKGHSPNPVNGMVRDVIGTGRLPGTGGTTTRHYFLADPGLFPVFAVGFIDGQEAPVISSQQSFEYDGMQIRILFDYGVAILDYRGAVTCAGQ